MEKVEECDNYLDGFCLKNIGEARVWDCTAANKEERIKYFQREDECPYPKFGKD